MTIRRMKKTLLVCFGVVLILVLALGFPANAEEGNAEGGIAANALITENPVDGKSGEPESDMGEFRIQDPRLPTFREVVIVYFAEMPSSLNELALKCGGNLIFVKEDIKMAAFETSSAATPGETSETGLDFVSQALKDPCVENAFKDSFMFVAPDREYSPSPWIRYPEEFEKNSWEYAPNKVSVSFWRLPPSLEEFASKYGGRLLRFDEVLLFATFETSDMTEFIKKVSADPYVRTAGPNGISQICLEPTDPGWGDQWGPENIYAPQAWDDQTGSTSIVVAIVDTGTNYNHEDLTGRVDTAHDRDFVNDDYNALDDNGHGTFVAGIVGARMNNGYGIAGMAQVMLLPVKVFDAAGENPDRDLIALGIRWAADNGAKIINMSFGAVTSDPEEQAACDYAYQTMGRLLFAAAGKKGGETGEELIYYPAAYGSVWAVGATDSNDQRASFSNYGSQLDLVAPGVDILSTYLQNDQYAIGSGTSAACAHVSGVAALVWSEHPDFQTNKARDALIDTAVDLGSSGWDKYYGFGKVNAYNAVRLGDQQTYKSGTLSGTYQTYTYSISVPAPSYVTTVMAGNQAGADFDLYVKWGSPPTQYDFDGGGASSTSLEWCKVKGSGTLYVMVRSYSGSGNWKSWVLTAASYTSTSARKTGSLSSGQSATYLVVGGGVGWAFSSGPDSGNFDLYIRWNTPPTTSLYDARGYTTQSQESAGPKDGSGTLYFMVRSRSGTGYYSAVGMIF